MDLSALREWLKQIELGLIGGMALDDFYANHMNCENMKQ